MNKRNLIVSMVLLVCILLSACASPTLTSVPVTKVAPTIISTMTPVVPVALNDAIEARLRLVAPLVLHGPNVDLFINGAVAVNGGQEQVNIPAGYITAYLFLTPGIYSVAVVPTGKGLADAILGPLDVTMVAGHRYTIAMLGQPTDKQYKPLMIDETDVLQKTRTSVNQNILFAVNNLVGTKTIDVKEDGYGPQGITFGGFVAAPIKVGRNNDTTITMNGERVDGGAFSGASEFPGVDFMIGFMGNFPGTLGNDFDFTQGAPTSDLYLIDFLQGFDGANYQINGQVITFNTFLSMIKTAGLTDLFTSGKPLLVLAPTDAAFAALPKTTLDTLMADPKTLANLVHNHVVEEYVPKGSLAKTPGGHLNRTFTNMLGSQIAIGDGYSVNGLNVGDTDSIFIADGTQVHLITKVLLPVQ